MPGELREDHVWVREQSEANRIYSKGRFGRPRSGGSLQLDFAEATYLCETGRLRVARDETALSWVDLLREASQRQPGFEVQYLVYRDLRERGFLVAPAREEASAGAHFRLWPRGTERPGKPSAWMRAVSERSPLRTVELAKYVQAARAQETSAQLAVVDEESDLTYYELGPEAPTGSVAPQVMGPFEGWLLADRVLVPDAQAAATLHGREFFGMKLTTGLHLSLVEALHLVGRRALRLRESGSGKPVPAAALWRRARDLEPQLDLRLWTFEELKGRGLIVKTGFKYGTHFRAYESRPEEGHAPFLVEAVPSVFESPWEPIARAVRLSHSVRKRFYLALVGRSGVDYLGFERLRL